MNRQQRRATQAKTKGPAATGSDVLKDFDTAVRLLQEGKLHQSEVAHRKVLASEPNHAPSLHHLGLIAFKRNAKLEAVDLIKQSLAAEPAYHAAWLNLAVILADLQRSDEAIRACRECIELQPHQAPAHAVLGNLLRIAKADAEAISAYTNSLAIDRAQPVILARLGELHLEGGNQQTAVALCAEALSLDAASEDAQSLQRRILLSHGSAEAAEAAIAAQARSPAEQAQKLGELGVHLNTQGRFEDGAKVLRRAVSVHPENANLHFDLAFALESLGQKDEAFAAYQAGLALEPNRADAYANVGTLLRSMDMMTGSLQVLTHAVALDPKLAVAHYNLALTYKELNRFEEAHASFAHAVDASPQSLIYRLEANNLKRVVCDWDGLAEAEAISLEQFRLQPTTAVAPFLMLSFGTDRQDQLNAGQRYAARFAVSADSVFDVHRGSAPGEKIRLGFLSGDFCEHATSVLLVEVLEQLDRSRFETFAYCFSPDDRSNLRHRVVRSFDRFLTITDMSDAEAARRIHTDGIDVLIDLKGYTKNSRPSILAHRPAPIQVNYLGYPGTMGASFIDYIIADATVAPMEHQDAYSEKIVHLPNCYQPNDRQRAIASEPISRQANGLPEDGVVFCSFNNSYKLNPETFDVWMRLLKQVPGSVLWLLGSSDLMRENLYAEAEARGIERRRIVYAGRQPFAQHLARHALADLFLDSLPCNAHTTTSDALWAGLPVLTCVGETFAGRVAGSLLEAAGLPELVTHSMADYEALALDLAQDRNRLRGYRDRLIAGRNSCALFDSQRYTRNLEQSFETMVTIMRSAEAPRPFSVVENFAREVEPGAQVAPLTNPRVLYDACPVCSSADIHYHIEAKVTGHPLYKPQLPPTMKWRNCGSCSHIFTEGYFTPQACEIVFSGTHANQKVGNDIENQRKVSARMVERVARHAKGGDWLDIGVGNGSLLFTAAEWGYRVVGTDLRTDNVNKLRGMGFEAYCADIHELDAEGRFNVVSMADVLEHVPFPGTALQSVNRLMRPGGAIFVSMPNMDSIVWRALDVTQSNPYWGELEHYHNFSRARLVALLEANGFKFAEYNISERYRSCMEVIAIKV